MTQADEKAKSAPYDILKSIDIVHDYMDGLEFEDFINNTRDQDAVKYRLLCISESCKDLPQKWRESQPLIPWEGLRKLGNRIRHEYQDIVANSVWETVKETLPELKKAVEICIENAKGHSQNNGMGM